MKVVFRNSKNERIAGEIQKNASNFLAVMVHGFKGSKEITLFKHLEAAFKKAGISSLRFDFPGCGESGGNYYNATIKSQASTLDSILKKVNYKKILLVGHSMGSAVSMISSLKNQKVAAMVLVNPLVFPYITFHDSLVKYSPYVFLSKFDPDKINLDGKIKEVKEKVATIIKRQIMGSKMFEEIKTLDLVCVSKEISIPCLIIHGSRDELLPVSHAQYLNFNIKGSKLLMLNYFHNPFLKKDLNDISKNIVKFAAKAKEKFLK